MSDKMRWRYGDTNPVVAAVDPATVIEIGDLLWQDVNNAKPASAQANLGSAAVDQETFTAKFLGVAMQRSRQGDGTPVRVATTGVFELDCAAGTFELGDMVAVAVNAASGTLLDQQVVKTPGSRYAIGRVAKRQPTAGTAVLVDIRSTIMTGGVEGSSASS
ncbi:MAG: capsid cement protein [Thermoguttaceae bacterium]|jgi:hypothetical protein